MKITKRVLSLIVAMFVFCTMFCMTAFAADDNDAANLGVLPENVENAINKTADYLIKNSTFDVGAVGGDWSVFGLARAGKLDDANKEKYAANVEKALEKAGSEKLDEGKSTENSRVVLALTAAGYDASDFAGYDLTEPLCDYDYVIKQGVNGAVYALLALDSADYAAEKTEIRDKYVSYIVSQQLEDGGFSYDGQNVDVDLTAMTVQALAKYLNNVTAAGSVMVSVLTLAGMQNEDGGYEAYGSECSESPSQVLVATFELMNAGINTGDEDFDEDIDVDADEDEDVDIDVDDDEDIDIGDPDDEDFDVDADEDEDIDISDEEDEDIDLSDEDFDNDISANMPLINAIMKFYNENGGFGHDSTEVNMLATEQCFYALTSVKRIVEGETSLYDMSDVDLEVYGAVDIDDEDEEPTDDEDVDDSEKADEKSEGENTNDTDYSDNGAYDDNPETGAVGSMSVLFTAMAAAAVVFTAKKRK